MTSTIRHSRWAGSGGMGRAARITTKSPSTTPITSDNVCSATWAASTPWASRPARRSTTTIFTTWSRLITVGWGLYTDEGSTGVEMRNNLVYRCSRGGFHQHYGKENRIVNNILAFGGEHQVQRTRTEKAHLILLRAEHRVLGQRQSVVGVELERQQLQDGPQPLLACGQTDQVPRQCKLRTMAQATEAGRPFTDCRSGFVDPANGDFFLKPGSPASKIDFQPFDYTRAGRRAPSVLTRNLPEIPAGFNGSDNAQ